MLARFNFGELDMEGVEANVASTASSRSPEVRSYDPCQTPARLLLDTV